MKLNAFMKIGLLVMVAGLILPLMGVPLHSPLATVTTATVDSNPKAQVKVYDQTMRLVVSSRTPVVVDVSAGGVVGMGFYLEFETLNGYEPPPIQIYKWLQPGRTYTYTFLPTQPPGGTPPPTTPPGGTPPPTPGVDWLPRLFNYVSIAGVIFIVIGLVTARKKKPS